MEKSELLKEAKKYGLYGMNESELGGSFSGELYILSDGKVVGNFFDDENPTERGLFLGIQDEGENLVFWNLFSMRNQKYPSVYSLCLYETVKNLKIGGDEWKNYIGKCLPFGKADVYAEMLSKIPEITEAMFTKGDYLNILAGIEIEKLKPYLHDKLIEAVGIHGDSCSLTLQNEGEI